MRRQARITSSSDITKPEPIEGAFGVTLKINARTSLEKHTQYTSLLGPHTIFLSIIITEYGRLDGVDRCLGVDRAMSIDQMIVHPSPIESLIDIPIVNASAGVSHSLLYQRMALYLLRLWKKRKIRLRNHNNEMRPRIMSSILGKYKIVLASAGGVHSILIAECSTILACGWCIRGQTGTAKELQPFHNEPALNTNARNELNASENECVLLPTPVNTLNSKFHIEVEKDIIDNNINKSYGIYRSKRKGIRN